MQRWTGPKLTYADVTPKAAWLGRRAFIAGAAALPLAARSAAAATLQGKTSKWSIDRGFEPDRVGAFEGRHHELQQLL